VKPSVLAGWISVALFAATAVYVGGTPFGGWLQSWLYGSRIRWQNAYRALDAEEPSGVTDIERRRLAWAHAEDEPPAGLGDTSRLHRPGTLARLRWETFDVRGGPLETWEVRALMPRLPDIVPARGREHPVLGDMGCPEECRAALARSGGALIVRSGESGIGNEWPLRMPVGQTFEVARRPLATHDIFSEQPHRVPLTSRPEGGRTVVEPAAMRVTLVEVCHPRARVGALMRLEFHPFAIVPIPRGFRTTRWVQLDGCRTLTAQSGS